MNVPPVKQPGVSEIQVQRLKPKLVQMDFKKRNPLIDLKKYEMQCDLLQDSFVAAK